QDWVVKINYANGTGDGHVIWRLGAGGDFTLRSPVPVDPWFSHQHNAHYIGDSTLVLFDNGNTRCADGPNCHIRGPEVSLDEPARQATVALNADLGNYSFAVGSAQRLPNGNLAFTSGFQAGPQGFFGQLIEVLPDGSKVYVLEINSYEYRAYRLSGLYEPTDNP